MRSTLIIVPLLVVALLATSAAGQDTSSRPNRARPAPPAALPPDSFDLARKYTQWFYTQQFDSLVAHHAAEGVTSGELGARLAGNYKEMVERAGKEIWVTDERFITRNGQRQYWRTATFTGLDEPLLVRWVMNAKGEITGLGLGPKSAAPPIDPAP